MRDRVVVITGAARGMGRAYTRAFVERGARVVAADRSWLGADDFRAELETSGAALVVECDITDRDAIGRAYTETLQRFGTVDVLINNAAMRQRDFYPVAGASAVLDTVDD